MISILINHFIFEKALDNYVSNLANQFNIFNRKAVSLIFKVPSITIEFTDVIILEETHDKYHIHANGYYILEYNGIDIEQSIDQLDHLLAINMLEVRPAKIYTQIKW